MKIFREFFITLGLVLCVGAISASAASPVALAANQVWNVQLFKSGEGGVKNLSTAFVGEFQYPDIKLCQNRPASDLLGSCFDSCGSGQLRSKQRLALR